MLYATVRQRKIHVKNPVTVIQNGVNVDELLLDMDDEWREMTSIVAVFTLKYSEIENVEEEVDGETVEKEQTVSKELAKEMLHIFGEPIMVPWECLQHTGKLSVSCTGYVGSEKVMTTMLPDSFWNVVQNGAMTGDSAIEPTPSLLEQIMSAATAAETAANAATTVSNQLLQDKANGVFDGTDGISPTVEIGTVTTGTDGKASVVNVGTDTAVKLNFVIPKGADGKTPVKGVDYTDGAQGEPGKTPVKGVDYFDGEDAAQITNIKVDENYHLIITLDNGMTFDAGYVRGAAGSGTGDMQAAEYDPNSAVRLAGGIPNYVAQNAPAPDLDGYAKTEDIPTKTSQLTNDSGFLTKVPSGYAKTEDIPTQLSQLAGDASHRTVTDSEKSAWNGKSDFSGSYNDLTHKPSSMTPSAHNQAASTITAGTFAGAVVANASGQTPGTALIRNTKLVATETTPTVNGEICWVYG